MSNKYLRIWSFFIFLTIALILIFLSIQDSRYTVAKKPPMGWNSYDSYNWNITELQVKSATDYMAINLKNLGWSYIVVDYAWYYPGHGVGSPTQDDNLNPALRMDNYGRLLPDIGRFPSTLRSNGFKPLADYIHEKGLKFGIHLMRGIPRQAVAQKLPILGTNYTADMIHNSTSAEWLNHNWGLDMKHPGAQAYLDSVFKLLASWGVDYVKIDDISYPTYSAAEIEGYKKAIKRSGRPMVLSLSPGPTHINNASHVKLNSNMWRIVSDLWDTWSSVDHLFGVLADWVPYRASGAWPDPDMIPIGRLSLMGPVGSPRHSSLTSNEKISLMTLWAINRAPLMWGGYLPDNTKEDLALMTNARIIAVNQNSTNNRQLVSGLRQVWVADIPGSNSEKYVALFNRSDRTQEVVFDLRFFAARTAIVTDLWSGLSLGEFNETFRRVLPAHGAGLFRLKLSGKAELKKSVNYYQIKSKQTSHVIDVSGASIEDGSSVIIWEPNGGANQRWYFSDIDDGYANIINNNSGKCLEVRDSSFKDGELVVQSECINSSNQQWKRVTMDELGYFFLKVRHSNKCLDISVNKLQLVQSSCSRDVKNMLFKSFN